MSTLCSYDEQDCIDKAKLFFKNWKENNAEYITIKN